MLTPLSNRHLMWIAWALLAISTSGYLFAWMMQYWYVCFLPVSGALMIGIGHFGARRAAPVSVGSAFVVLGFAWIIAMIVSIYFVVNSEKLVGASDTWDVLRAMGEESICVYGPDDPCDALNIHCSELDGCVASFGNVTCAGKASACAVPVNSVAEWRRVLDERLSRDTFSPLWHLSLVSASTMFVTSIAAVVTYICLLATKVNLNSQSKWHRNAAVRR